MLRGRGGSERGSVAITVALALTLLLGLAALVVDVGLNWAARTSAQTAADSAALAGASRLLVDGPTAAISTVQDMLTQNLVTPGPAGWALDGQEDNGEVVCWTLPDPPPATIPPAGFRCPQGSNALRVITPPMTFSRLSGAGGSYDSKWPADSVRRYWCAASLPPPNG